MVWIKVFACTTMAMVDRAHRGRTVDADSAAGWESDRKGTGVRRQVGHLHLRQERSSLSGTTHYMIQ